MKTFAASLLVRARRNARRSWDRRVDRADRRRAADAAPDAPADDVGAPAPSPVGAVVASAFVAVAFAAGVAGCGIDEPLAPIVVHGDDGGGASGVVQPGPPELLAPCVGEPVTVTMTPSAPAAAFGEFQALPGTGVQEDITITPSCAVSSLSLTIFDPDYAGNAFVAYDGNTKLATVEFAGDDTPDVLTTDTEHFTAPEGAHITRIVLVPAPDDYVSYGELALN